MNESKRVHHSIVQSLRQFKGQFTLQITQLTHYVNQLASYTLKTSTRRQWYPVVSCVHGGLPVIGRLTPGRAIIRKFCQASGKEHSDRAQSLQNLVLVIANSQNRFV